MSRRMPQVVLALALLSFVLPLGSVLSQGGPIVASDDFSTGQLNTDLWTFVNPEGDGSYRLTGAGSSDAWLNLTVTAGIDHDVWTEGNHSVRVMQNSADTNLDLEVKFETPVSRGYQLQGLILEQDQNTYLRFDFYTDGNDTNVFGVAFRDGMPVRATQNLTRAGAAGIYPLYMRISRRGDLWRQSYSLDGETWTRAAEFTYPIMIQSVGIFAGNTGNNPPEFTSVVDYFYNLSAPIAAEDPYDATLAALYPSPTFTPSMTPTPTATYTPTPTPTVTPTPTPTPFPTPMTLSSDTLAFRSDDFSAPELNMDLWTFTDPIGDDRFLLTGQGTEDAYAVILLPEGSSHDVWVQQNDAPRLMQPALNANFELEVKFSGGVISKYQMQGIFVWQDEGTFLRLEFYSDSNNTHMLATIFIDGNPTRNPVIYDEIIAQNGFAPLYMRIKRDGHNWSQLYSLDGRLWTQGAQFTFPMVVTEVGFYGGTAGLNPSHGVRVDYFENLADPITQEDPVK
jgi:regulation of enolase protein 1 (concanavalin A-like superfamily)